MHFPENIKIDLKQELNTPGKFFRYSGKIFCFLVIPIEFSVLYSYKKSENGSFYRKSLSVLNFLYYTENTGFLWLLMVGLSKRVRD
jgi:hypothetical protein